MPAKAYLALMRRANTGNELPEPPLAPNERRQPQDDGRRTRSVERLSAELEALRVQQQRIDLAAKELEGKVTAARFVEGRAYEVIEPQTAVRATPTPTSPGRSRRPSPSTAASRSG